MAVGSTNAATQIKRLSRSLGNNNNRSSQPGLAPRNLNSESKSPVGGGGESKSPVGGGGESKSPVGGGGGGGGYEEKSYAEKSYADNSSYFRKENRVKEAFGLANIDKELKLERNSEKAKLPLVLAKHQRRVIVDEKDAEEDPFALDELKDSEERYKLLLKQRFDEKEGDDELFTFYFSDNESSDGDVGAESLG